MTRAAIRPTPAVLRQCGTILYHEPACLLMLRSLHLSYELNYASAFAEQN
jgi:hypothetical protein